MPVELRRVSEDGDGSVLYTRDGSYYVLLKDGVPFSISKGDALKMIKGFTPGGEFRNPEEGDD